MMEWPTPKECTITITTIIIIRRGIFIKILESLGYFYFVSFCGHSYLLFQKEKTRHSHGSPLRVSKELFASTPIVHERVCVSQPNTTKKEDLKSLFLVLFHFILSGGFGKSLSLFKESLRDQLMFALGVLLRDPTQLELKVLVFDVVMDHVNDASGFLEGIFDG
jgi:hypothetical protein